MYRPDPPDELAGDDAELLEATPDELAAAVDALRSFPAPSKRRGSARQDPDRPVHICSCHGIRVADATPLELVDGR